MYHVHEKPVREEKVHCEWKYPALFNTYTRWLSNCGGIVARSHLLVKVALLKIFRVWLEHEHFLPSFLSLKFFFFLNSHCNCFWGRTEGSSTKQQSHQTLNLLCTIKERVIFLQMYAWMYIHDRKNGVQILRNKTCFIEGGKNFSAMVSVSLSLCLWLCEDENLMKASIVVVVLVGNFASFYSVLRHLRTFVSCNNFPNNHSPPSENSTFARNHHQATFCCDSHKFPHFPSLTLSE